MSPHREHTILLSRERVNKGTNRMNSLPLSPLFQLTRFYWENRCLQILRRHYSTKLVPRPFCVHNFFGLYINLAREATLCQNILNVLRIFARISKFRCFHEAKQTQHVIGKFSYNLAEFVFE